MDTKLLNQGEVLNSLQVSILKDVPTGNFNPGIIFLLKNITQEEITVSVVPAGQNDSIETIIYPGWNPELIKKVINAPAGLQYGY